MFPVLTCSTDRQSHLQYAQSNIPLGIFFKLSMAMVLLSVPTHPRGGGCNHRGSIDYSPALATRGRLMTSRGGYSIRSGYNYHKWPATTTRQREYDQTNCDNFQIGNIHLFCLLCGGGGVYKPALTAAHTWAGLYPTITRNSKDSKRSVAYRIASKTNETNRASCTNNLNRMAKSQMIKRNIVVYPFSMLSNHIKFYPHYLTLRKKKV